MTAIPQINIVDKRLSFDQATETLCTFFKGHSDAVALILVGPSGVGKSHLVESCATRSCATLKRLVPEELSNDSAGIVEATIVNAFNPHIFLHGDENEHQLECEQGKGHVVFIDDLDIWAPSKFSSPLHLRVVATLNDMIQDLVYGQNVPHSIQKENEVRFIATASTVETVHSSLIRSGCINNIIRLSALSHTERREWCRNALKVLYHKKGDGNEHNHQLELSEICDKLAFMTPGFVHADMHRLFATLSRHSHDDKTFPRSPKDLIGSSCFRTVSRGFTPTLLSQLNPLLSSLRSISSHPAHLYGMNSQLTRLNQCLNAVFSLRRRQAHTPNDRVLHTLRALKKIRTLTGILIHGPTGCGKSALVHQAVQALPECAVNVLPLDSASIVSSVIGQAERNLTNVFAVARMIAPTVIVVDNVDVLAPRRDDMLAQDAHNSSTNEAFSRMLSTLLVQIDGIRPDIGMKTEKEEKEEPPVLVIATTRDFSLVDPALLRPGRIDVHIPVEFSNRDEREQIISDMLSRASELSLPLGKIDKESLVEQSEGWSTADVLAFVRHEISKRAT